MLVLFTHLSWVAVLSVCRSSLDWVDNFNFGSNSKLICNHFEMLHWCLQWRQKNTTFWVIYAFGLMDLNLCPCVRLLLAVQVWQCGGSMEVLPCARVAHIERTKKPYNNDIDYYAKRNALRAAEVWMDEYKSHVYMAWNIPMNVRFIHFRFSHSPCSPHPLSPTTSHLQTCSLGPSTHTSQQKFDMQISPHLTFILAAERRLSKDAACFQTQTWKRRASCLISLFSYTSL